MKLKSKFVQLIIFAFVITMLFALCANQGGKKDGGGIPPDIDPIDTLSIVVQDSIPGDIDPIDTLKVKNK